jgi:arsenate reductase
MMSFNPQSAFAAILTCSQADGACPFITGAEKNILLKTQKHLIIHPNKKKNMKERPNRYGAFLYSHKKNNMSATNCTPALNRKKVSR